MAGKPNILIAVPAYKGVEGETLESCVALARELTRAGISFDLVTNSTTGIEQTRNFYASYVLENPRISHLLFTDSDMGFQPRTILTMLHADKPLIGCVCPRRTIDLKKALDLARSGADNETAIAKASKFCVKADVQPVQVTNGIARVSAIGMAITLIRRDAIEAMHKTAKLDAKTNHEFGKLGLKGPLLGFFNSLDGATEDYSFCRRYASVGGEVHALLDENIVHVGAFAYRASFPKIVTPA